jgi:hypothetical protein
VLRGGFGVAAAASALLLILGMTAAGHARRGQGKSEPRKPSATTSPAEAAKPAPTAGHKPAAPRLRGLPRPDRPTADPTRSGRPRSSGPTTRPAGLKSNQSSKRNNGSARVLAGKICLIHLFVRDGVSSWAPGEKDAERRRVAAALAFLREQGRRYRQRLSFVEPVLPEVPLGQTIPVNMFDGPGWIERAIRKAGHRNGLELVRHFKAKLRADHAMIMVHVNKEATSFNLTYYSGVNRLFHAERVVMYARYGDGRATCAASYAHEILHAFGAGELYFPFDRSPKRKRLARRYFPNDIMLRVAYSIDALEIGPYTAYRIGWLDRLDERHKIFED